MKKTRATAATKKRRFRLSLNYQDPCLSSYFNSRHRFTLATFQIDEEQNLMKVPFSNTYLIFQVNLFWCSLWLTYTYFFEKLPLIFKVKNCGILAQNQYFSLDENFQYPLYSLPSFSFFHINAYNPGKKLVLLKKFKLQIRSVFVTVSPWGPHLGECAEKCI